MRRILLGGLGLALGVFAPPVFAQQPRPTSPPARGAAFGKPSAVSAPTTAAPVESEITPVGLFRNGPSRPSVSQAPPGSFGAPTPVITQPPGTTGTVIGVSPVPAPMPAPGGMPLFQPGMAQPVPPPRPVTGTPPSVTETRDPTGRVPTGTVVPSVSPDVFECPEPGLDEPMYGSGPRFGLDRLRGMGQTWVSAEVLLWWNRSTQVPPLVTTGPINSASNGILGQPGTQTLLAGTFGDTYHVGGRIGVGHWFGDSQCRGVDARLFWVAPTTATFTATTQPGLLLARPFTNVNPTVVDPTLARTSNINFGSSSEVVAGLPLATGSVVATMKSTVWGAEANYRRFLAGNGCARLDGLIGYRYLDVREELTIMEQFARVPGSDPTIGPAGNAGRLFDRFRTENHFHGGQVGLVGSIQRGRWSLDGRGTVALGTVFQSADITGGQQLLGFNGALQNVPGGLLAVPGANIGHFEQNRFAVVPEVGVNLGYQVTSHLKVFVGYNFLYLSSAVRPGGVIDQNIDAARVPNLLPPNSPGGPIFPAQPMPQLHTSGYFIQGINFGLVYRW